MLISVHIRLILPSDEISRWTISFNSFLINLLVVFVLLLLVCLKVKNNNIDSRMQLISWALLKLVSQIYENKYKQIDYKIGHFM